VAVNVVCDPRWMHVESIPTLEENGDMLERTLCASVGLGLLEIQGTN